MVRPLAEGPISFYNSGMTEKETAPAGAIPDEKSWEELAKNILRAEMMRHGASYATLAEKLAAFGIADNELNLRNKVSRGRFTAVFLLQCLKALESEWIHIPALEEGARKGGAQALAKTKLPSTAERDA